METFFITGTGTGVGKTLVAAMLCEALQADYWKPIQAGYDPATDSDWVRSMVTNTKTVVHPETYLLKLPASPHIAATDEGIEISIAKIVATKPDTSNTLVIEGAGGLLVPLNKKDFMIDLIAELDATVIIVSRNELGSINHSLLTAQALQARKLRVMGWIFNDEYLDYENEIVEWSGFSWIASVRNLTQIDSGTIHSQSVKLREHFKRYNT